MVGDFKIRISSKKLIYDFTIKRKITKIAGYSATGKTQLHDMLYSNTVSKFYPIRIECKYKCESFPYDSRKLISNFYDNISTRYKNHNSSLYVKECRSFFKQWDNKVFFLDEDSLDIMNSNYFAAFCKYTDSFFVLITRSALEKLPYSYTDIYDMKESGKYHWLERSAQEKEHCDYVF